MGSLRRQLSGQRTGVSPPASNASSAPFSGACSGASSAGVLRRNSLPQPKDSWRAARRPSSAKRPAALLRDAERCHSAKPRRCMLRAQPCGPAAAGERWAMLVATANSTPLKSVHTGAAYAACDNACGNACGACSSACSHRSGCAGCAGCVCQTRHWCRRAPSQHAAHHEHGRSAALLMSSITT